MAAAYCSAVVCSAVRSCRASRAVSSRLLASHTRTQRNATPRFTQQEARRFRDHRAGRRLFCAPHCTALHYSAIFSRGAFMYAAFMCSTVQYSAQCNPLRLSAIFRRVAGVSVGGLSPLHLVSELLRRRPGGQCVASALHSLSIAKCKRTLCVQQVCVCASPPPEGAARTPIESATSVRRRAARRLSGPVTSGGLSRRHRGFRVQHLRADRST